MIDDPFLIPTHDVIYLDHAATTPVDPAVLAAMQPWFTTRFGNPSSIYQLGQEGRHALDQSRSRAARVLECDRSEVIFTSCATESNNLAMQGVAWHRRLHGPTGPPPHLIVSAIEHHAVLHPTDWLAEQGFSVTTVPVDGNGFVDPGEVQRSIRPETCLISVMYANNETGAIQPVAEIGKIAREHGVLFHCDAVQAAGSLPLTVNALGVDLLSLSAHKFYGPKSTGLLYVRKGTPIAWQQLGGGQEEGRRGGTENVAGIVGMAIALEQAERHRDRYAAQCAELRDRLLAGILEEVPGVTLNGPADFSRRLPNNLNLTLHGVQGETALLGLDMQGVAASAGSACTTGNSEPSHVLQAMGYNDERCRSSLRLTVGRCNSAAQIDDAVTILAETVERIRSLARR